MDKERHDRKPASITIGYLNNMVIRGLFIALLFLPLLSHAEAKIKNMTISCGLDTVEDRHICSLNTDANFVVPKPSQDADTYVPIDNVISIQFRANEQVIYEWKNDPNTKPNHLSDTGESYDRSVSSPAVCGRTYNVQLYVQTGSDSDLRKIGETAEVRCPRKAPR
jgi:hypothetical protein